MSSEADIPAPRRDPGDATNISNITLPKEEKTQADTNYGLSTIESESFLKTPSIGEVHCEVNYTSPDASEGTKKPDSVNNDTEILLLRNSKSDYQPEDPEKQLESTGNESHEDVEKQSKKTLENIITNDTDPKFSEKTAESLLIRADGSHMEHDKELEKESEKLPVTEISTGKTNDNESAVIDKVKDEDEDLCRAELSENEKNTSTLLKEDLHVIPENSKASDLGQDNETTSSSEEQSTNVNLHGITSDDTEDKQIDAVETQKEVLESFSTIVSSNPEEGSTNAVLQGITSEKTIDEVDIQKEVLEDSSTIGSNAETKEKSMIKIKIEELLEKESDKTSSPQDELCEIETSTESMLPEIETKIQKPEDSLNVAYEDIKTSDLSNEIETSSFEEQTATAHSQDGKTDDKALDAAEIKEEIFENVQTIVSNEKTEENSFIQDDDPQNKYENLEKDSEKPFLTKDLGQEIETSSFEEQSTIAHSQIILDQKTEDKTRDAAESKEENLETEENLLIQVGGHLEKDSEKSSLTKDLGQEIETSSFQEQSAIAHSQIILDQKTEDKARDAAESKEENLENVSTIDSNEKTEENLLIQVSGHLEKDSEKPSLIKDFIGNANDDELTVMDEVKSEDVMRAELFEKERNIESDLLKEEVHVEKPAQSIPVDLEDNKASDLGQHTETTSFCEVQGLTENPQGTLSEKTEETTDAADTKNRTQEQQNVEINISNEDNDKNSSIQLDASQMKHDTYLEKEIGKPQLIEASTEDINDESTIMHEAEIGNESIRKVGLSESDKNIDSTMLKKENLQEAPEDHKPSASSEDIKTTFSIDEQSLIANPQSIMSDKTSDATDTKEVNLEHVATKTPHEHAEENLPVQVDCSQTDHEEHLGKESENLSLTEASLEEQQYVSLEKHTDSLQVASDDIKTSDSTHDSKMSGIEEEILTTDPREISNDKKEETTDVAASVKTPEIQDIATNILDGDNANNSLIEADGSEKQSLKEVSLGKADNNVSAVTHEAKFGEEHLIKADLLEKEKHEGTLVKEKVHIESLQVADEDIKASALVQDREKSSLEEQSLTTKSQGIMGDGDKTNDATNMERESQEDKNAATTTSYEDSEENSQIQVDVSQLEQSELLEKESESTPLTEAPARDTAKNVLAKEEADMEKPTDNVQVVTEDTKASGSGQDTETSFIKVQIPIADPQQISSDKIEENTIVAAYTKEKTLEDVATKVPNWDNEDNLPIEVDGSQKPSLKEASMGNANDDESINIHEAKFVDKNLTKANLIENEKSIECTSVEKEVLIESLQEAGEDIKACASCHDRETTSLVEQDPIMGDKEDKTTEATNLKEETPEEKNVATTHEDTEENSLSQVDSSQMEQKEHLEKESQNTPLVESGDTTESTLEEEERAEEAIENFQIVTGNIKASASGQDTEISSKEGQIPPADPQEISCEKTEEKTTDTTYTHEELIEDIVPNVQKKGDSEDNPSSLEKASTTDSNGVESSITHEAKLEDEKLIKVDLVDNEKYTEGILVNEKIYIDSLLVGDEEINTSASSQERETTDAIELEEETCQDKNSTISIPYEDAKKNSLIQVDNSQVERNEHLKKESENPYLTKAQTGDTTESALLKEEPETEKLKDSFQVAPEDIKASASSQYTETCFIGEQIPTVHPQEISCDKTKERIIDVTDKGEETLEVQDIAIEVLSGENEDNSATKVDGSQKPSLTEASTGKATEVQKIATNVASGDNEDNSPTKVDGSQDPSLTEASTVNTTHHESKIKHELRLVDESFLKADLAENEKNTDGTLVKEEKSIESLQVTTEDIKACAPGQDREASSQEEQSLIANPQKSVDNDREDKTIDATDLEEETSKETASKPVPVEIPSTKDLDVNTDTVVDMAEDPNCKQEESSITTASEEHTMICNEHVANVTSSASEPSEQDIDKTDTEKMTMLDDGSTKIPTNENLVVTYPTENIKADAQVRDEENKAELKQQDTETGASQDVSDSSNSVTLEKVSSSNVASEKDLTYKPSLESRKETWLDTENEKAQKQDGDLHVSAPVQDSSMEQIENEVQPCPASATDSEMQELQKVEEAPLPAPNKKTIENTDCKESEVVEDATKSFLTDEKLTEREQEETECKQEKVLLDETVGEIKEPASIPVANDFLPKSFIETSEIDHSTAQRQLTLNREDLLTGKTPTGDHEESKLDKDKEEASEQKISDFSSAALNIIETGDKDGANRSIADVKAKIDGKAPEVIQTAPSATESQEVESISVGETSASISQCERDDYEHAHIGTEEKPDSNEVGFAPEESKSGYEAKSQVVESIDQVQCCGMISKAGENLKAAAEIKSETVIVDDIFEQRESMKVNISSKKINEDEDVNDRLGSCKEKAIITESHVDQVKQEEKTNTEEIFEVIKNSSETEKVSKVPKEAGDKAVEKPEEKLQENESKEQEKSIEDVTKISDTREVNSSTVAFLEDGHKLTRSDDVDNEIAKDEGFLNQNSNTSVEDATSGAQPKRHDENIMCGAPPTKTVHTTIDDTEDKKENANTVMMQHQADDSKRKHESTPLPEFTQGIESEKQGKKDETCSSDEVQTKDGVRLMLSEGKGNEEATKEDTRSKQTDDEDKNTYAEAEKVDFSTHTEDTTEVSQHDAAQDVPPDYENSPTKNENLETKVSSEGQEAEANWKAPMSETLEQEIEEQQLKMTSEAVTKEREANRQEDEIMDDDCNELIEKSSCAASEKISKSNVHQSSMKDTSTTQSDKNQERERQIDSLPTLPVAECSDIEIAEKYLPMQISGLYSTGGTELNVTPIPSDDKHIVLKADQTKNINPENSIGNKNISVIEHGDSAKCSQGENELLKTPVLQPEEATCEHEEKTSQETTKSTEKSESKEIDKSSPSLFQVSIKETSQTAYHSASEKETATHSKHRQAEKVDEAVHEEMKTDEEKDDEEESSEQRSLELCSEAPVMVDTGDADVKVAHKKSHNILSGVGSKVKHSIAKVKKAITGKSSHPKPPSPK